MSASSAPLTLTGGGGNMRSSRSGADGPDAVARARSRAGLSGADQNAAAEAGLGRSGSVAGPGAVA
jgi:hypothetical protein